MQKCTLVLFSYIDCHIFFTLEKIFYKRRKVMNSKRTIKIICNKFGNKILAEY